MFTGLVPSANRSLPEPMLTDIYVALCNNMPLDTHLSYYWQWNYIYNSIKYDFEATQFNFPQGCHKEAEQCSMNVVANTMSH